MTKQAKTAFSFILLLVFLCIIQTQLAACSNSEYIENSGSEFAWVTEDDANSNESLSSSSKVIDYLPIDDTEYPYAGIPRIVIETENHQAIKDRETEIPAKLQIWGEKAPESEVMDLTIKGRGNSSWNMPKKSYKIEFINKQTMLRMPKDRDWALIANYADKTLMKNYLIYHLSAELGAYYAPRCEFVELYLNKEYLGVYLLTETIKIAKHRINLPDNNSSYIVEFDIRFKENDQVFYSRIIRNASEGVFFHYQVHKPSKASPEVISTVEKHIQSFETFLKDSLKNNSEQLTQWLDIDEYIKHYWIQEFSKNPDANFKTSVYFSWQINDKIKMGPVWDFDLAFGGYDTVSINSPQGWYLKESHWNKYLFEDSATTQTKDIFWDAKKALFYSIVNNIDTLQLQLQKAASNNFKRWDILNSTSYVYHQSSFQSYNEATEYLKQWITQRLLWIDEKQCNLTMDAK